MILVKTFYAHNELRNFSYLITDNSTGDSWVIDPYDSNPIIDYLKKNHLTLAGILNTHQHHDHIRGNASLIDVFKSPVHHLSNMTRLQLDHNSSLQIIDTPGHTMDHQAFVWNENEKPVALFSGDTLFNSGVGNCRGGGDPDALFETTQMLHHSLPAETLLYPGHDYRKRNLEFALSVEPDNQKVQEKLKELSSYATENLPPSTLWEESEVNPFFRLDSLEIKEIILSDRLSSERELFLRLRKLRDQW